MANKQKLEQQAEKLIKEGLKLGATQVEVVLWSGKEELTRFANNEIHQSVSLEDATVHVRAVIGKKIGVARGNSPENVVKNALAIAKLQREDKHFKSLPKPRAYKKFLNRGFHLGAVGRAESVKKIISGCQKNKLSASGAFSESEGEILVANSLGVLAYQETKSADLSVIATGKFGSGYAGESARGGKEININKIITRVRGKATFGEQAKTIEPGKYEVILEPAAVVELLDFFTWLGPNARVYHEDVSFFQGNLGKKLFDAKLSIVDDPHSEELFPSGFDLEGFPKKPLSIVEKGVLKNVAYDSYHAAKYKKLNTGHAFLAPNTWGPMPSHLKIEGGKLTLEDSIKKIKRGILVTRFWYTRVVHHKELILTGMTRDGTFLIENGKITSRLVNLRYTESVVEVLKKIKGVGSERQLVGSEGSMALVPHLHLASFNFTGVAKHA